MATETSAIDPNDRVLLVFDDPTRATSVDGALHAVGYETAVRRRDEVLGRPIHGGPFDLAIVESELLQGTVIHLLDWMRRYDAGPDIVVLGRRSQPSFYPWGMAQDGVVEVTEDIGTGALIEVVAATLESRKARRGYEGRPERPTPIEAFSPIVADSLAMSALVGRARIVAGDERSVLLRGASGTGKKLLARCIHAASPRHAWPLATLDADRVPPALIESELFGMIRSSCSGPPPHHHLRPGLVHLAEGSTLLVSAVEDLEPPMLAMLLDAIDAGTARPVGRGAPARFDVRFLFTMSRDPEREIAEGRLRREHYDRLSAVVLVTPQLADRRADIIPLAERFRAECTRRSNGPERPFSTPVTEYFLGHPWPGNVEQLRRVVERAVAVSTTSEILLADLPDDGRDLPLV